MVVAGDGGRCHFVRGSLLAHRTDLAQMAPREPDALASAEPVARDGLRRDLVAHPVLGAAQEGGQAGDVDVRPTRRLGRERGDGGVGNRAFTDL